MDRAPGGRSLAAAVTNLTFTNMRIHDAMADGHNLTKGSPGYLRSKR
jgi:hypothetical protein